MLPLTPSPLTLDCEEELWALPAQLGRRERILHFPPEKLTTTMMWCIRSVEVREVELNWY
jgi:hypothetical protein